jgi:uncharacterized protein
MAYTLYDATITMAKGSLTSLLNILNEAQQQPNTETLLAARLVDDMNPLPFQVYYASYQAQALAAKLSGHDEYPKPTEELDSFEKMVARVKQAIDALEAADKETVNRVGETMTRVVRWERDIEVPVKVLVERVYLTNVYFHVAMAYAILRKEGVALGKRNWTRGFVGEYL